MLPMDLIAALVLLQAADKPPLVRSVLAAVTDAKGSPIRGLTREEIVVLEDGVARDVTRFSEDDRPLSLAVLVDSSEELGSIYRLHLIDAVESFLRNLPDETRYTIWTFGDRPRKILDDATDPNEGSKALKRVPPVGGNTLFDALVEAARDLTKKEGDRSAIVVVTGLGQIASYEEYHSAVDNVARSGAQVSAVQFEEGPTSFEDRQAYEYVLSRLAAQTGGIYETVLSPMGVAARLRLIATDLRSQYRLSYVSGGAKSPKIELKVARENAKVRFGNPKDER